MKKLLSSLLAIIFVFLIVITCSKDIAFAIEDVSKNHWAIEDISKMSKLEIIKGYPDGSFRAENSLKRGEFMALVARTYGAYGDPQIVLNTYKDVAENAWYIREVAGLLEMNALEENKDSLRAEEYMTREEATVILAKMEKLREEKSEDQVFEDWKEISHENLALINRAVEENIINGFPDRTFKPKELLNRAQAARLINNAYFSRDMKEDLIWRISKPGIYGGSREKVEVLEGDLVILSQGTEIRNLKVKGDLILARSIFKGDARLENIEVLGTTYILGGGEESIYIESSRLNKVIVDSKDRVRVVLTGESTAKSWTIKAPIILDADKIEDKNSLGEINIEEVFIDASIIRGDIKTVKINKDGNQDAAGAGQAGSGGRPGSVSSPTEGYEGMFKDIDNVVRQMKDYARPKMNTSKQRDALDRIIATMESYKRNPSSSIDSSVDQVRSIRSSMGDGERKHFDDMIQINVTAAPLNRLNNYFKFQ